MQIPFRAPLLGILKKLESYVKTDLSYFTKSAFWLNLNSVIGAVLSFGLTILFARYVSKDVYGMYKYVLSVASVASTFSLTGMNAAVIRAVAQGYDGVFKRAIIEQLKWAWPQFLISFSAGLYYFYNHNIAYGVAFLAICILGPISSVSNTYIPVLYGKKDFRMSASYGIITNILYSLSVAAVIFISPTLILLVLGYYVASTAMNVYGSFRVAKKYPGALAAENYRTEDISYAKHLSLMGIIGGIANQLDNLLVYYMLGPVPLALYSFATGIPERVRTFFGFIGSAATPKIAEKDLDSTLPNLKRKTWQLVGLAALMSLAYIVIAPYLFKIFFPQYMDAVIYSQIFSLSLIAIATNISYNSLLAHRKQKELYYINFGVPLAKIAISAIGIWYLGIWGAIVSKMAYNVLLLAASSFYLHRKS